MNTLFKLILSCLIAVLSLYLAITVCLSHEIYWHMVFVLLAILNTIFVHFTFKTFIYILDLNQKHKKYEF